MLELVCYFFKHTQQQQQQKEEKRGVWLGHDEHLNLSSI